jgi:hypothetical protein
MKQFMWSTASILLFVSVAVSPALGNPYESTRVAFQKRYWEHADSIAAFAWDHYKDGADREAGIAAANHAALRAARGDIEGARSWHETASERLTKHGDEQLIGRLKIADALVDFIDSRQYGNAEPDDAFEKLVEARKHLGSETRVLDLVEAEMQLRSNEGERAQTGYLTTMRLMSASEASGDSLTLARCAASMARMEGSTGGHAPAERGYDRAFRIFRAAKLQRDSNIALRNVGLAQWKQGKLEDGRTTLESVVVRADRSGDRLSGVLALNDLSMLLATSGDAVGAISYDRRAHDALRALAKSVADHGGLAEDLTQIYKMRYVGKPDYIVDLFGSFYSYLMITQEVSP